MLEHRGEHRNAEAKALSGSFIPRLEGGSALQCRLHCKLHLWFIVMVDDGALRLPTGSFGVGSTVRLCARLPPLLALEDCETKKKIMSAQHKCAEQGSLVHCRCCHMSPPKQCTPQARDRSNSNPKMNWVTRKGVAVHSIVPLPPVQRAPVKGASHCLPKQDIAEHAFAMACFRWFSSTLIWLFWAPWLLRILQILR